jgi:hypothetical protein
VNTEENKPTFMTSMEGAGSCSNLACRYVLPRISECAPIYFDQGHVNCSECGETIDLWQAALEHARRLSPMGAWALGSLGAGQTSFVILIETNRYYTLELTDYGVPADARILRRNYTGQGGDVTAIEWHGNAPPLRFPGTVLRLLGVPLGEGPIPRSGPVSINVFWIRSDRMESWPFMVTAFEAAAAKDYAPSLVFAQSAVEISMMPVIEQRLRKHAPADRVENFMRDSLTYSHALNVVLPYLSAECGAPKMPDAVRGALNKLRKIRNAIIHKGPRAAAVSAEDAMEGLCAAAFGFEYMRHVSPTLLEGKT